MSSAPADLLQFRADARTVTGLGAADVGIVGDGAHQKTGGYHEGKDVLVTIGRYHAPATANVGSGGEDYSARQARDRNGLTNSASASDVGSQWPHGGRAAWLRWNNLLYAEMRDHQDRLPALRAINVSLDGKTKKRFDQLRRDDGLIASTDTVDTHTHLELWRDTEGNRKITLDRIVTLMRAAVTGTTPTAGTEDDMTPEQDERLKNIDTWLRGFIQGDAQIPLQNQGKTSNWPNKTGAKIDQIATKVGIDPAGLGQIEAAAKAGAGEAFAEQRQALIDGIVAALPQDKDGTLGIADVRAVLVDVLLHGAAA
ncbi:hypothetical protein [Dactylosporangium sp. NPDC049140]|jgi:hypothetical protein|uniref:hypothetical protein n=1 Tax=Dactylosporangium sp. NPDC049140 TaxID=3155647 RepID=UPI0033DCCF85